MKQCINSLILAFSMYSKIPMPQVEWKKENMRYVMCFFPFVGLVIGLLVWLYSRVIGYWKTGSFFVAAVYVLLPVAVTGGIHIDGFMDTMDALHSWQPKEKRLEILKDPHTGAFAVISFGVYLVASLAVWSEIDSMHIPVLAVSFVFSRTLSGLSVTTFPCAKNSGLAATFSSHADKKRARRILTAEAAASAAAMIVIDPIDGIVAVLAALCVFGGYRKMSMKYFGGITGDLAGWFLVMAEFCMAAAVMIAGEIAL
jgi:adenosylcobinamide-GDP ribazoletransferase